MCSSEQPFDLQHKSKYRWYVCSLLDMHFDFSQECNKHPLEKYMLCWKYPLKLKKVCTQDSPSTDKLTILHLAMLVLSWHIFLSSFSFGFSFVLPSWLVQFSFLCFKKICNYSYYHCRLPNFTGVHQVLREGMINIAEKISTKYHDFGLLLLDDQNGTRVSNMELKYREDAKRINKEILQEWATGRGKKPVSWETLTEVLRDIELCTLASEIEAVKSKSASSL